MYYRKKNKIIRSGHSRVREPSPGTRGAAEACAHRWRSSRRAARRRSSAGCLWWRRPPSRSGTRSPNRKRAPAGRRPRAGWPPAGEPYLGSWTLRRSSTQINSFISVSCEPFVPCHVSKRAAMLLRESQRGEVDGALEVQLAEQDAGGGNGGRGTFDVRRGNAEVGLLEHYDLVLA